MTADNKFAARLRELSRAASAGPWEVRDAHGPMSWSSYDMTPDENDSTLLTLANLKGGTYFSQEIAGPEASVYIHPTRVESGDEQPGASDGNANAALIIALRNHADRLADLVERVEAYREAGRRYDACVHTYPGGDSLAQADRAETEARNAMLAALDALAPAAGDAASGTESPPRINGDAP